MLQLCAEATFSLTFWRHYEAQSGARGTRLHSAPHQASHFFPLLLSRGRGPRLTLRCQRPRLRPPSPTVPPGGGAKEVTRTQAACLSCTDPLSTPLPLTVQI